MQISKEEFTKKIDQYQNEPPNSPYSTQYLKQIVELFKNMSAEQTLNFFKQNVDVLELRKHGWWVDSLEDIYNIYQTREFVLALYDILKNIKGKHVPKVLEHLMIISDMDE